MCGVGWGLESKIILKRKFSLLGNTRVQVRTILKLCGHESLYRRKKRRRGKGDKERYGVGKKERYRRRREGNRDVDRDKEVLRRMIVTCLRIKDCYAM